MKLEKATVLQFKNLFVIYIYLLVFSPPKIGFHTRRRNWEGSLLSLSEGMDSFCTIRGNLAKVRKEKNLKFK